MSADLDKYLMRNNLHNKMLLLALCLPIFLTCVDVMAVVVAMHSVRLDFSASLGKIQWLLSGYTIGIASFLILIGELADCFGRRKLLLLGILIFALVSVIAAASPLIDLLIICRFVQGIAGAMIMTTSISIITQLFSKDERGRIIALWALACGLGIAVGPLVGGIIIYIANWRWLFLINFPICVISYYFVIRLIPESKDELTTRKINWFEAILLSILLVGIVALLAAGGNLSWSWYESLFLGSSFIVLLSVFIVIEYYKKNPLFDYKLFNYPNFMGATVCGSISYFFIYAWTFVVGVYLQHGYGMSALSTGLLLSAYSISIIFGSEMMSRYIQVFSNKAIMQFGFIISGSTLLWMSAINNRTSIYQLVIMFLLFGFAQIIINIASLTCATKNVPNHKAGIASGIIFTLRWLGGSIGVVIITFIYQCISLNKLIDFTKAMSLEHNKKYLASILVNGIETIDTNKFSVNQIDLLNYHIQTALAHGLFVSFVTLAIIAFLGFVWSTLFLEGN